MELDSYFDSISSEVKKCYAIASAARLKCHDPEIYVEVHLARNMAERVEGLIASVAPQLLNSGLTERISELEKQFGAQDWRVALVIASEVASEKFCKFKTKREAMEVGIRVGFAYHTVGVVAAPLEGFIELAIKKRKDGKEYLAPKYAGPVRGAGGTAAAVSVLITDYVAKTFGYSQYDPSPEEIERMVVELEEYHERVVNLQYKPSLEEIRFLAARLPVEIDGDPTEELEVSNYKDLPRIETNRIRGGVCLVFSMLASKAPKLHSQIKKWSAELGLDWSFLGEFIKIQRKAKSKHEKPMAKQGITPDFTYIADLPAGRPVLSYPLTVGGFRLRYGRSRFSGYSSASIHPATMRVLNDFIAVGTQLKLERPGKASAVTVCDSIDGPIVKLDNGSVVQIFSESMAKLLSPRISEILFLGDILVSYGDFLDRAHPLVPAGYCEEWWHKDVLYALSKKGISVSEFLQSLDLSEEEFSCLIKVSQTINFRAAFTICTQLGIPLHPRLTYWWDVLEKEQFISFLEGLRYAMFSGSNSITTSANFDKIIVPFSPEFKHACDVARIPHIVQLNEFIIFENQEAFVLSKLFPYSISFDELLSVLDSHEQEKHKENNVFSYLSNLIPMRRKTGTFIGARMGRPEKSKMRRMTGSPHGLFPVGKDGDRLRAVQSALKSGKVTADFRMFFCASCNKETIYPSCEVCSAKCLSQYFCRSCNKVIDEEKCKMHGDALPYRTMNIDAERYFTSALSTLNLQTYPDIIKGVRGTSSKDHDVENLAKAILRAKHGIYVNKDGTTRYDMTELPITHFTPEEVHTPVSRLIELGYTHDINHTPLVNDNQIIELMCQDIILPVNSMSADRADDVLIKTSKFIDDLLEGLYGLSRFYNISSRLDLVGHLVMGIAPHISAAIIGRIIGFSHTQGCLAHPLWHAAQRRDCDGDENCVILLLDGLINFSKRYLPDSRGSRTMDAPLVLTEKLIPSEVDDMAHRLDIAFDYPLQLYVSAEEMLAPDSIDVPLLGKFLGQDKQYLGLGYTHTVSSINQGVLCSAYKILPSMEDKLKMQMNLAEKLWSVNASDVARLVIDKHFLKDIIGNLRQFSMQKFRCVKCNAKYRRPPLAGRCIACSGKLLFTVTEGTVTKYLMPSISLAEKYHLPPYTVQRLDIVKGRIESIFGRAKEKQENLGRWFG